MTARYDLWLVPTEEGKSMFGEVERRINKRPYENYDDACLDAYLEYADDPAPDKGDYYKIEVRERMRLVS